MTIKQIFHVEPVYKERIWGGHLIKTRFNGNTPIEPVGELWCVAPFQESGDNVLRELKMDLSEAYEKHPELFNLKSDRFPIRCTLMDPIADLSVQVHPNEKYAMSRHRSYGKDEAWYIVETGSIHHIQFGHHAKSKDELVALIDQKKWKELLHYENVNDGDFIDVPAGTIHAIARNMVTFEIARSSDLTFRIYDYDRIDAKTGRTRELHLMSAKDVISVPHVAQGPIHPQPTLKDGCLVTTFIDVAGKYTLLKVETFDQGSFVYPGFYFMTVIAGEGLVDQISVMPGETLLIPHGYPKVSLSGKMTILISSYRD